METIIRRGKRNDLPKCAEIAYGSEVFEKHFSTRSNLNKCIMNWFTSGYDFFVCCKDDGEIVGFCVFMELGSFGDFPYIKLMVVKTEYRSMGIGKNMLKYCEERSSKLGMDKIFLFVDDFNTGAKKLYESFGYEVKGEIRDLWTPGIKDFMMVKKIKSEV